METPSAVLQQMMWHSGKARTREITDTFGARAINVFTVSIAMPNTRLNHIVGCGGPAPDQMTLADDAVLYEGVANGTLLSPANHSKFLSLMAGKRNSRLKVAISPIYGTRTFRRSSRRRRRQRHRRRSGITRI
jgi:hypothetical protein